ncbi:MAG: sugar ABC transporter substrate-binding protein [Alphaproteobacteria bacterium]|nr:MAG: sugar ABC transporter substrate-binding protein [Alphaproteobacteria bacterium]
MSMRYVMGLFAFLLASLVLGGDTIAAAEGKRVMLLGTANTNPYIGAWTASFAKVVTQAGMKVTNLSSNYDAAVQSQQIDDAIAQKFDMIVLCYVNDQAIVPALTRAKAAGIPVILWATPIKKDYEELFTSYVGTDHSELGRIAGENMVKGLAAEGKTKAQVIAVTGLAQQIHVATRIEAFKAVIAKHPAIELVAVEDGKWNTALSEKITGELLVRFSARGGVDGIFAMADNQATGSIQAVESAGLKLGVADKGIVIVASNCMKDGIVHINSGQQYSTATQIPTEEAQVAANKVSAYFNGQKLNKYEMVPVYGITKENVGQFAAGCSY